MGTKITSAQRQSVIEALKTSPKLAKLLVAMVEAAKSPALESKSAGALVEAAGVLPAVSIKKMRADLRADDCLYDDRKIWKELGTGNIPRLPHDVIVKAWVTGGRIILHDSSISRKARSPRLTRYCSWDGVDPSDYPVRAWRPVWIVVPSHIDKHTVGCLKSKVVTSDNPAPALEDWFAMCAYA
jgi:hypothetical protein